MAEYNKGFMGSFVGKLGPAVGSSWKRKSILRSVANLKKSRKSTQAQTEHKAKFALAVDFALLFERVIAETFQTLPENESPANVLTREILEKAIAGTYPDFSIDYAQVPMARGRLRSVTNPLISSPATGSLQLSWDDDSGGDYGFSNDRAIIVVYCPELKDMIYTVSNGTRALSDVQLNVSFMAGREVHVWVAFKSVDGKRISDSRYAGSVLVS